LGDSNRAKTSIVIVCKKNLTPCADKAAIPPTTDFCFRSAIAGCAKPWCRDAGSFHGAAGALDRLAKVIHPLTSH
jgi:hypothetical protein